MLTQNTIFKKVFYTLLLLLLAYQIFNFVVFPGISAWLFIRSAKAFLSSFGFKHEKGGYSEGVYKGKNVIVFWETYSGASGKSEDALPLCQIFLPFQDKIPGIETDELFNLYKTDDKITELCKRFNLSYEELGGIEGTSKDLSGGVSILVNKETLRFKEFERALDFISQVHSRVEEVLLGRNK